jgi:hypothetical protein
MDCPLKYMGQTDQTFYIRYKEHNCAVKNNSDNVGYSKHILNTGHACDSITDIRTDFESRGKRKTPEYSRKYHTNYIYVITRMDCT